MAYGEQLSRAFRQNKSPKILSDKADIQQGCRRGTSVSIPKLRSRKPKYLRGISVLGDIPTCNIGGPDFKLRNIPVTRDQSSHGSEESSRCNQHVHERQNWLIVLRRERGLSIQAMSRMRVGRSGPTGRSETKNAKSH